MAPRGCRQPSEAPLAPRGGGRPAEKAKIRHGTESLLPLRSHLSQSCHITRCHLRGKPACLISFFLERTFIACRGENWWGLEKKHSGNHRQTHPCPQPIPNICSGQQHYSHSRCCRPRCRPASPLHRSPREGHVGDQPKNTPAPGQPPLHTPGDAGVQWGAQCLGLAKKRLRYPILLERGKIMLFKK